MLKTILFLISTLLALPIIAVYSDHQIDETILQTVYQMIWVAAGIGLFCFIVSELTGNYSQVDKLWSLLPIGYVWYFAVQGAYHPRLVLMAILVTIWGLRLTYNFYRRGGYSWPLWRGEEDYRWGVLQKSPLLQSRRNWTLFNLGFISLYQNLLILLFTLPIAIAWQGNDTPLNWLDYLAAAFMLGFICMETTADNQHWRFHLEKQRLKNQNKPLTGDYAEGFCQSGLWACFRHPNYAAEQAIWISFYLFSVAATDRWFNASLAGAILLMLLFQGSADFSEKISASKYPTYRKYQKSTGKFLPKIF